MIRKLIREVIEELFDKIELPKNFEIINKSNSIIYKFVFNEIIYGVEFSKAAPTDEIMAPDKRIMNIINNCEEKFVINFGLLTKSNEIESGAETNQNNAVQIIDSVCALIKHFIKINDVKIIIYYATKKRDLIYKYIYNKHLKNDFVFYSAKEKFFYDRFLIKKELING